MTEKKKWKVVVEDAFRNELITEIESKFVKDTGDTFVFYNEENTSDINHPVAILNKKIFISIV